MGFEQAAPCRHQGAPPEILVNQVVDLLRSVIAQDDDYLRAHGLNRAEFERAFPAAVERIRGSWAANNQESRVFAYQIVEHLVATGAISNYDAPKYGRDTIYRLRLQDGTNVGLIQKGCPDGAHSSTNWQRPSWADELYLWWLCSSLKFEPGEHVWKGVSRVVKKVRAEPDNQLDGVIFFNSMCGTAERPCPKLNRVRIATGAMVPPPCVYVFPRWDSEQADLNWRGTTLRRFPEVLLSAFDVDSSSSKDQVGFVGFSTSGHSMRTEITARFGPGKATSARG